MSWKTGDDDIEMVKIKIVSSLAMSPLAAAMIRHRHRFESFDERVGVLGQRREDPVILNHPLKLCDRLFILSTNSVVCGVVWFENPPSS